MKTSDPASLQVGLRTTLSSDIASGLADLLEDGDVGDQDDWLFLSGPEDDGRLDEALTEEDGKWKVPGMDWLGKRKAKSPFGKRLGMTDNPAKTFPPDWAVGEVLLLMSPLEDLPDWTMPDSPAGIWTLRD